MPIQQIIYKALERAGAAGVSCAELVKRIDGTFDPMRHRVLTLYMSPIRVALKAEGRKAIVTSGRGPTLRYTLVDAAAVPEPARELSETERDAELLRLTRKKLTARQIATRLGFPNRQAVLARVKALKSAAAVEPAPVAPPPPAPPEAIPELVPGGLTGQRAALVRLLMDAKGAFVSVNEIRRVAGSTAASIRGLITETRSALRLNGTAAEIQSRGMNEDLAYAWVDAKAAPATETEEPEAGPKLRITLPPIGGPTFFDGDSCWLNGEKRPRARVL